MIDGKTCLSSDPTDHPRTEIKLWSRNVAFFWGGKHTTATAFGSQHFITYSYQTRQILQACQDTFFHDFNVKRFHWTPI